MYPHDIVFELSNTEKLVVDLEQPFEKLPCYCQMTINFYESEAIYVLTRDDDLETSMERLSESLTKSLDDELCLHSSITGDIGYDYNEYLKYALNDNNEGQLNPNLVYEGDYDMWVGVYYQLWSCGQWAAWMYNDNNGAIVFEITPRYPGFFVEEGELVAMPSYEEWMQKYQSAVTRIIPKEIAQQWLKQTNNILVQIKDRFCKSVIDDGDDKKMIYEECPRRGNL